MRLEQLGHLDRLLHAHAPLVLLVGDHAHADREVLPHLGSDRLYDLHAKPHPVFQRPAVLIRPAVERAEKNWAGK